MIAQNIKIGGKVIGNGTLPFIIAEAGINHNGNIDIAKRMVLAAKKAGADAIKFQTFHTEEFVKDRSEMYTYHSQGKIITEPMFDMFKRNEFTREEWKELKEFCVKNEILFLSTPQNVTDLEMLLNIGIEAIKIGSDDFVNIPLIKRYAQKELPMFLSCGMATRKEVQEALNTIKMEGNKKICLLLCTSEYPTPPEDVNIKKLDTLAHEFPDVILGFSDHTQGNTAAIMAVGMGARVFEKHFTLKHSLPGPDHWFSEEPHELELWVEAIHTAYHMLGSSEISPTEKEKEMRKVAHRSVTTIRQINKKEIFTEQNLGLRRPGTGLPANVWEQIIGKRATRAIAPNEQLTWKDVES